MITLLVFSLTLLLAALISEWSTRSLFSSAILFLFVGTWAGTKPWFPFHPAEEGLRFLVESTLFTVLFTDGGKLSVKNLRRCWALPARALALECRSRSCSAQARRGCF